MDEPHITIGSLRVWIAGRQFEDVRDYRDGNWLVVRAEVRSPGSIVSCERALIHGDELQTFLEQLDAAHRALSGTARLQSLESHLNVEVAFRPLGHADLTINITPDPDTETHRFHDSSDQTYLAGTIREIRAVLAEYPVVGTRPPESGSSTPGFVRIASSLADLLFGKKIDWT
jgi:hypothetical protein